jgi:hypothetical protein
VIAVIALVAWAVYKVTEGRYDVAALLLFFAALSMWGVATVVARHR